MADDRTFEYNAELQGLQGDAIVDLWILDLKPLDATLTPAERIPSNHSRVIMKYT